MEKPNWYSYEPPPPRGLSWPIRLRKVLLLPFSCKWNAWVRDFTAKIERTRHE